MQKLAIDIDGVLANFTDSYAKALFEYTGINFPKNSTEWPKVWNWELEGGVTPDQVKKVWSLFILQGKMNFWRNLEPLPQAKSAIQKLNMLANRGYDVYFLTNRLGEESKLQTEKWLYDLGMNYPTVVVAADKLPILRSLGVNFFIDDKPETILEVSKWLEDSKTPSFRLYMQKAPYNVAGTYHENVRPVSNILEALQDALGI